MQDSLITFRFKSEGVEQIEADAKRLGVTLTSLTRNANGTFSASGKLSSVLDQQSASTKKTADATDRASKSQENYFVHIAKTTVQSALVNKAFLGLVEAAGQAVKQVDLLQNFPASMAALGLSSKDASASLIKLRDYISGVGGDLTTATTSVARFAEVTKNIKAATAEFVGVNNALIAGGAGADVQANALEQLIQAYSRGVPQLIEWKSLMVAMPAQLNQVAQAMKLPNAQALGESLTNGTVSMQSFVTELTKLSTGTGAIAQQAIARMQGIGFASNVLKNALTNGLAAIYQAVGRQNIISFFSFLTQVIIELAQWAVNLINILITLFNFVSKIFGGSQVAHFSGEVKGAATSLGEGASNAGDMADNLGSAGKNAQKLSKSLASFDKMNVLPDKTSGSSGGGAGGAASGIGATGLDPSNAKALDGIFGDIAGKLQKVSTAAKIFAGLLAGLTAKKFLTPVISSLSDIVSGFKNGSKAGDTFSKKLGGIGKQFKSAFKSGTGTKEAIKSGGSLGNSILQGLGAALGTGAGKIWKFLLVPLIGVITDVLFMVGAMVLPLTAALTLPFWAVVAIGAVIVAAIVALIVLIWKNWDKIWGWIKKAASATWNAIKKVWSAVSGFFVKIWQGIYDAFAAVIKKIKDIFTAVINFLKEWGLTILAVLLFPLTFLIAAIIVVVGIIIAAFKAIWAGIVVIFSVVAAIISAFFQAAWDAVVAIWNAIVGFFQGVWDGIVAIFTAVGKWFGDQFKKAWDAVVAIWNKVAGWFNTTVWQPIVTFFSPVVNFFGDLFSRAWNAITAVWDKVAGWFSGIWKKVKDAFSSVGSFFANIFQTAWDKVTGIFSGLWSWFKKNVWDKIVSVFSGIGTSVSDAISGAFKGVVNTLLKGAVGIINGFINAINWAIGTINKIPGVDIKKVPTLPVPKLARGGIIDQPTIAMLGEAGQEAVVPLENNTEWIDKLASKISSRSGDQPVQLTVQIGEERIVTKMINLINERSQMTGRNVIKV